MAQVNPINISSSDSDIDFDEVGEVNTYAAGSSTSRLLPTWADSQASSSRNRGYGGENPKADFPSRFYPRNGYLSGVIGNSSTRLQSQSDFADDVRSSDSFAGRIHDSQYFVGNGDLGLHRVNSRIGNGSGKDYEKLSSQQALKRTLPPSVQPSSSSTRSNNLSASGAQDIYGNIYHPAGPSSSNGMGYVRDQYSRGSNEDIVLYENSGSRMLPSSLAHGKSVASTQLTGSGDPVYRSMVGEERVDGADERLIFQAALEEINQPKVELDLPDGLLSVSLLRHQKIALAWMLQKETKSLHCAGGILADDQGLGKTISIIALIQLQKTLESRSKSESQGKTEALTLDDDDDDNKGNPIMGNVKEILDSNNVKSMPKVGSSSQAFRGRRQAGTLVVCPASVLRQWARELDEKVAPEAKLSFLIYHGGSRTKDPAELAKYDVVLTTYTLINVEVPKQPLVDENEADEKDGDKYGLSSKFSTDNSKRKKANGSKKRKKGKKGTDCSSVDCGPLAKVNWSRVVLDEAQTIKNHRTQVARACCSLRAKKRWCLSGTPIQNAVDDLFSYFRFLRYEPYSRYKAFYFGLKAPISRNAQQGYKKIQAVLRAVMLRRTKGTLIDGQPIIKLPPKSIRLTKVDFAAEERAFYTRLEADSRSKFKAYAAAGTVNQNYANILLMLLRLRQACDHPILVKGVISESFGKESTKMAKQLPRDMVLNLLNQLATSMAICRMCNDPPEDSVVTMCGHVFCYQCVSEYLTGDDNMCPAPNCKELLGSDIVFSEATLRSCISANFDISSGYSNLEEKSIVLQDEYCSSKIKAVLEILHTLSRVQCSVSDQNGFTECNETSTTCSNMPSKGPIKTIIFSQWTSMLDLVQTSLNNYCIQYRRLDGKMTLGSRDKAVKDFNSDPEVIVMLMSLKAGNLGLNMVSACHVILLDLWWNPTTEDQAVDRAHRIGQTRPVNVTRLTIKDTVEDRILALQEEKRKMVASAFGEDHNGGAGARLTVEDLKYLFKL
ncbi:hypothetical protein K2173_008988 [Erythroxylum novogranatense]|uniref:Helicase-like transcription factor CHR28 n=1 Tax=Erythroxylum novogranatense TaxID=1862640 RepID=A0AAV8TTU3_9ROSI|nr:hypothetical protein K2173_008988 [Erythroxylum novogranatense]